MFPLRLILVKKNNENKDAEEYISLQKKKVKKNTRGDVTPPAQKGRRGNATLLSILSKIKINLYHLLFIEIELH